MMKPNSLCFFVLLLFFCSNGLAQQKPNVILIVADDLGFGSIGCYGSKDIRTPNIDRLAAGGILFTDFHSNGLVCSPTRAALMTGRYQQRSGVDGVITAKSHRSKGLSLKQWTMGEMFQEAGYRTAIFGKWHLGYRPTFNPVRQGFDKFDGFVSGNVDQFSHIDQEGWFDWWIQEKKTYEKGYVPKKITDRAIQFLNENPKKPFFLYLPYPAPHYPYQGPNDQANRKVRRGETPKGLIDLETVPRHKGPAIKTAFIEMIEDLDKQVGRIEKELKRTGKWENTVIVFCSDNGGATKSVLGENRNGVLRGGKGQVFEGGHRVPGIIHWPGKIEPRKCNQTVMTFDLMPTFADLLELNPKVKFDGVSLKNLLLQNQRLKSRVLLWSMKKKIGFRDGKWKIVLNKKKWMLFDLDSDPSEKKDISKLHPELFDRLKREALKLKKEIQNSKSVS